MPENGELVEVVLEMPEPCGREEAENVERLMRPEGNNYWLAELEPVGDLPAARWVARYEWYDNNVSEMML